jgi:ubiquinone/menaquinone biosynthesis C-methylase UbiE
MDVSEVAVAEASRNGLHAVVGNAEDGIPFEDSAFDIVIAGETIEHIVRTDWFLHEVNRVTKIGGSLILTTPNVASLTSLGMMLLLDLPPYMAARYRSPHVRDFTIRTLKAAVSNHGYRTIEVRGAELMFPLVGAVLPSIGYVLPRLSPQIILHAEKMADSHFDEADEIELSGHP